MFGSEHWRKNEKENLSSFGRWLATAVFLVALMILGYVAKFRKMALNMRESARKNYKFKILADE
jgi:hypothetical protein